MGPSKEERESRVRTRIDRFGAFAPSLQPFLDADSDRDVKVDIVDAVELYQSKQLQ